MGYRDALAAYEVLARADRAANAACTAAVDKFDKRTRELWEADELTPTELKKREAKSRKDRAKCADASAARQPALKALLRKVSGFQRGYQIIYDSGSKELAPVAQMYAQGLPTQPKPIGVRTKAGLLRELKRDRYVGVLVLYFHGVPGGLLLDGQVIDLADLVPQIGQGLIVSDEVIFEGCSVAQYGASVVALARAFQSPGLAICWNWWHVTQPLELTLAGSAGDRIRLLAEKLPEERRPYLGFGVPSIDAIAAGPKRQTLYLEWFRDEINEAPLPTPVDAAGRRRFRSRGSAEERRIPASAIAAWDASDDAIAPVRPLIRLTIEIH